MGDGDFYFLCASLFYIFGRPIDFTYLAMCYLVNMHWLNVLKPLLHHSRPQYDDVSLAEINRGDCAAEFGNPSGHALLASQFILTTVLFIREDRWQILVNNKILRYFFYSLTVAFFLGVCSCRLYLGRHTVDQILFGACIGLC